MYQDNIFYIFKYIYYQMKQSLLKQNPITNSKRVIVKEFFHQINSTFYTFGFKDKFSSLSE